MHLSEDHLTCVVEAVIDQYANRMYLLVMLAGSGDWSQLLQIAANRQTHLYYAEGSNHGKLIFG